jgi:hypothetical protein
LPGLVERYQAAVARAPIIRMVIKIAFLTLSKIETSGD